MLVSANDHVHTWNSAHYADRAVDIQGTGLDALADWYRGFGLRVYWPGKERNSAAAAFKAAISIGYLKKMPSPGVLYDGP